MYDENIFNDVEYLLNKSVLFDDTYQLVKKNVIYDVPEIDDAYMWADEFVFSKESALTSVDGKINEYCGETLREYLENAKENLEKNILPHIKDNPNTEFYIFYPPYSMLEWNRCLPNEDIEASMDVLKYVSSELLKYDNVNLYFFMDVKDVVTNLDYYKDYSHYSDVINSEMVTWIKEDKYILEQDTCEKRITDFGTYVKAFDYNAWIVE